MRRSFVVALSLAALVAAATAHAATSKLDPRVRIALSQLQSGTSPRQMRVMGSSVTETGLLDVFIRGDISRAELEAMGVTVRTSLPGVCTAYVPPSLIDVVAANSRVTGIRGSVLAEPTLNVSVPATGADLLRGAGPTFTGLNGAGVLVGDVDTGIDIHHGDFKEGGLSRILYLWDQTVSGTPPSGFAIGQEWFKADIDANTCTETDPGAHGTHVMGIEAGNGSQTGGAIAPYTYVGMAPRADIAMVKTTLQTGDILDGVNYIFQKATATGKNAIVNLSLGSEFGPHDGTSDFETALSALVGPGRIVTVAAGNDRGTNWHAGFTVPAGGDSAQFTVVSTTNTALGNPTAAIDGYYNAGDNFTITLRSPTGATVGPLTMGNINAAYPGTLLTGSANVYMENGATTTSTGAREVYIEVTRTASTHPVAGVWTIIFSPVSLSGGGRLDMWKYYSGSGTTTFTRKNTDDHLVSEPGDANGVITVAAWETKNNWTDCGGRAVGYTGPAPIGAIATFSGIGPSRDGRQKPDIAAPGMGIGSTRSFDVAFTCGSGATTYLNDNANHVINQGTSMAAPHAAGAVALLLEKFGAWTPAQMMTYFNSHAVVDGNTGVVWNASFGNGKLHLGDLIDPLAHVVAPNGGDSLHVGLSSSLQWTASDNVSVTSVDLLLSRTGAAGTYTAIATGIANTGSFPWTVTGPASNNAFLRVVAHDAESNQGTDISDASFTIVDATTAVDPGAGVTAFAVTKLAPNPSKGSTNVEFTVPRQANVKVSILDLAGREVAVLASGPHAVGRYQVLWSGEVKGGKAPSGLYFVRMQAPGIEASRRLILTH